MSGATADQIQRGVAAAFRLVPGINSAVAYLEQPPPSLTCAVVLPAARSVQWAPDGAILHRYDLHVWVLATTDTSATELVALLTTLSEAVWSTLLLHVGACGTTTALYCQRIEPSVTTYLKQRYAALDVAISVEDERAELPDLGSVLV